MDSLQLVLITSLVAMVAINAFSLMWALRLNRELRSRPAPKVYELKIQAEKVLSEIDLNEVERLAKQQLSQVADKAAGRFRASLNSSVDQLSVRISDMANTTLSQEFEKYQISLQALRDQSIQEFSKLQKELDTRRTQLVEHLDRVIQAEGEKRLGKFDERLNDVISSYLAESLGVQVDLGAQSAYVFETLQKHKDEIKRDILS